MDKGLKNELYFARLQIRNASWEITLVDKIKGSFRQPTYKEHWHVHSLNVQIGLSIVLIVKS